MDSENRHRSLLQGLRRGLELLRPRSAQEIPGAPALNHSSPPLLTRCQSLNQVICLHRSRGCCCRHPMCRMVCACTSERVRCSHHPTCMMALVPSRWPGLDLTSPFFPPTYPPTVTCDPLTTSSPSIPLDALIPPPLLSPLVIL